MDMALPAGAGASSGVFRAVGFDRLAFPTRRTVDRRRSQRCRQKYQRGFLASDRSRTADLLDRAVGVVRSPRMGDFQSVLGIPSQLLETVSALSRGQYDSAT